MRRSDALEDNTLDGLQMATSVVEIKRRTVRSSIQNELWIAERGTYVVQIVGGQASAGAKLYCSGADFPVPRLSTSNIS